MDLTWAVTRLSSTNLFTAEDPAREDEEKTTKQTIPGWSGYDSLVFPDTTRPTVIGYFPMTHALSTEFSTIKTVMKKAQNICTSFDQKDVVVSFGLAIYSKNHMEISRRISRHPHSTRRFSHCSEFPSGLRETISELGY